MAKSRLDVIIFVLRVYAFHDVFCYAGKCFDTSVIDITFTTPYVFLYLEEVLEKKYSIAMQLSTLYDTFFLCIQKIGPKKAQKRPKCNTIILSLSLCILPREMQS